MAYQTIQETVFNIQTGETIIVDKEIWVDDSIQVPKSLTPRQIRMVLTANNLRQAVEDAVAASTDYNLKDWWEYSLEYLRDNPLLDAMATSLGLTSEQVDQLFIEGAKL